MKRHIINRSTLIPDLSAGLVLGIQSIPSGMANGLLAKVNPIYGLHGCMVGVLTGAFFTSSAFMSVQGTSAMALVIASVPEVAQGGTPNAALFALAFLTGLFMLGQLDDFTGCTSSGANRLMRTIDLFQKTGQFHIPTLLVGTLTIILILVLRDKKEVGSTFLNVVARYAGALRRQKSKLMLAGVDPHVVAQMERTGIIRDIGRENLFQATQDIGQALMQAVAAAESWIGAKQEETLGANG